MFHIGSRTFALISVTLTFDENLMRIAKKLNIWAVQICRKMFLIVSCQKATLNGPKNIPNIIYLSFFFLFFDVKYDQDMV